MQMSEGKKLLLSASAASLVSPVLFSGFFASASPSSELSLLALIFVAAWIVTLFHLMLLGLPAFVWLERYANLGWLEVTLAGAAAGSIPVGILSCPLLSVGSKTGAIWLHYMIGCMPYALLGAITAIVLWRVLLILDDKKTSVANIANARN
jgi:hypothetical protein